MSTELMAPAEGTRAEKRVPTVPSRYPQENAEGTAQKPHKQAEEEGRVPSGTHSVRNSRVCARTHNARTRAYEATIETEGTEGTRAGNERQSPANAPRTFAASKRAQGPRRWHVLRSPDDELDLIGASKPWGVFVDDADSQFDDIFFVAAFRTHAAAIKFVDRQARS